MPEAGDGKDDHHVEIGPLQALPAAAQGDVDIVPEPLGEGNVPPVPEVLHGRGEIGTAEVVGDPDPEEAGYALCHADAGHKVRIELDAVEDAAQKDVGAGIEGGGAEDGIHHDPRLVGDHELEEKAPDDQADPLVKELIVVDRPFVELLSQLGVPGDRALDDLGEP